MFVCDVRMYVFYDYVHRILKASEGAAESKTPTLPCCSF